MEELVKVDFKSWHGIRIRDLETRYGNLFIRGDGHYEYRNPRSRSCTVDSVNHIYFAGGMALAHRTPGMDGWPGVISPEIAQ
jgi:hypothetical protein